VVNPDIEVAVKNLKIRIFSVLNREKKWDKIGNQFSVFEKV
jgi:hypothetical protein